MCFFLSKRRIQSHISTWKTKSRKRSDVTLPLLDSSLKVCSVVIYYYVWGRDKGTHSKNTTTLEETNISPSPEIPIRWGKARGGPKKCSSQRRASPLRLRPPSTARRPRRRRRPRPRRASARPGPGSGATPAPVRPGPYWTLWTNRWNSCEWKEQSIKLYYSYVYYLRSQVIPNTLTTQQQQSIIANTVQYTISCPK